MESLAADPEVKQALRVAAKLALPSSAAQKLPLSKEDLAAVLRALSARQDFIWARDAAMFAVGWAGMVVG
jgi:hypothetical protein